MHFLLFELRHKMKQIYLNTMQIFINVVKKVLKMFFKTCWCMIIIDVLMELYLIDQNIHFLSIIQSRKNWNDTISLMHCKLIKKSWDFTKNWWNKVLIAMKPFLATEIRNFGCTCGVSSKLVYDTFLRWKTYIWFGRFEVEMTVYCWIRNKHNCPLVISKY